MKFDKKTLGILGIAAVAIAAAGFGIDASPILIALAEQTGVALTPEEASQVSSHGLAIVGGVSALVALARAKLNANKKTEE